MVKRRLNKLYKVTVTSPKEKKQLISFFKKKTTVDKFIRGAEKLAKKRNLKIRTYLRKPIK